jgi:hypothetical protein
MRDWGRGPTIKATGISFDGAIGSMNKLMKLGAELFCVAGMIWVGASTQAQDRVALGGGDCGGADLSRIRRLQGAAAAGDRHQEGLILREPA